ncbi:hypothetical protein [Simkania negevensis]|uniref:Uncharacterized protein n=1 Tax=Simkania negevensis (strain ATCC VR-1471 / DSM 27360 / Z) TaxID=331113 RepID=F8L6J3_SIMNZ|nr:hypothetical protein [Simkania negevensis]CCB88334.1 hypothetical protein SNE_A04570 [Simkania negevensis Z]
MSEGIQEVSGNSEAYGFISVEENNRNDSYTEKQTEEASQSLLVDPRVFPKDLSTCLALKSGILAKSDPAKGPPPPPPLTPQQIQAIKEGTTNLAEKDGLAGINDLYSSLSSWLKANPFPPEGPYPPWNDYAKKLQNEVGAERSKFQQQSSNALSGDISKFIAANPSLGTGDQIWDYINKTMSPNPFTVLQQQFTDYSNSVQNSLINPVWSGKPGILPAPPVGPDMQPLTEATLKIDGVSYVLLSDPNASQDPSKSMAFPVSHTSDSGGQGMPDSTSTEAIWYTLENAYDNGDKTLFQQTMNAYHYLVEQKKATVDAASDKYKDWAYTPGLAGWILSLGIPPGSTFHSGGFPYPQGSASNPNLSTATDADEQIINLMINGLTKFGDLDLHCFGSFPNQESPSDIKMSALLQQALGTFLTYNISNYPQSSYDQAHHGFKFNGVVYNPVLSNDNWGGGGWTNDPKSPLQGTFLNPSYFDPTILANIYAYATSKGFPKDHVDNFHTAVVNSVKYLQVLQSLFQDKSDPSIAGMPDNPAWNENDGPTGKGPHPVGWDSIRFLTNVGKFVDFCENKGNTDPFGILADVKDMGSKMLKYVITNSSNPYQSSMILGDTPQGANLDGGALLGPLLVAMKALTPNDPNIPTVEKSLADTSKIDMAQMDPKRPGAFSYWQSQYYGAELALTNKYDADHIGK